MCFADDVIPEFIKTVSIIMKNPHRSFKAPASHWSVWCFCGTLSRGSGWSSEEELGGVRSLHREDSYPNKGTNAQDGDLCAEGDCGNWEGQWCCSRGNPCLKSWPSLCFSSLLQQQRTIEGRIRLQLCTSASTCYSGNTSAAAATIT